MKPMTAREKKIGRTRTANTRSKYVRGIRSRAAAVESRNADAIFTWTNGTQAVIIGRALARLVTAILAIQLLSAGLHATPDVVSTLRQLLPFLLQ
jgi:hypothetical protein